MTKTQQRKSREKKAHWVEWATGIVSAFLVLAMLGWTIREAWRQTGEPPSLALTVTASDAVKDGLYRVEFDIANTSTTTAAAVGVAGELHDADTLVERSEVTFDYVPAESKDRGAIFFRADPKAHTMTLSVMGYTEP